MSKEYDVRESTVHRPGDTALWVRQWHPKNINPQAQVLILHGYLEHGGRYAPLAEYWASLGLATSVFDMRGHGRSSGQRAYVERFSDYLDDAEAISRSLNQDLPLFVLGHSNGGLIALDWLVSRRPSIRGLIVTNPFLGMADPPRGPKLLVGRLAGKLAPRLSLPAGLRSEQMSHDPVMIEAHKNDPLIIKMANAAWLREVTIAQQRVLAYHQVPAPLLFIHSDIDPVADPNINRAFAQRLESPDKTTEERLGELHEVLNETKRRTLYDSIAQWVRQRI